MALEKTLAEYDAIVKECRDIFVKKTKDYGTSWRVMRPKSLTDQMYIKAKRIRTIDESGEQKVEDSISSEFIALVNYGYMALIQLSAKSDWDIDLSVDKVSQLYDAMVKDVRTLMIAKNTDYGEAWREMRISSFSDMILVKLHRIKQIESNQGNTLISEGVENNYKDIINYSIFALIQINNKQEL
ncbi:MAG: DUF1599 domain-containing protein [Chitinophagales bacterium]|nr:DUF1599 domain-containing protein [Chitinophagales bacterium]